MSRNYRSDSCPLEILKENPAPLLKQKDLLIAGNTVLFQISVESPAMKNQCQQSRVCLTPTFAFIFPARPPFWIT